MKRLPLALAALLAPAVLAAQSAARITRATNSITPEDVRRRIAIIADDSMRGRNTPSPELEEVASYIAGEFRRFGLRPGGDSGTFLQRYALDRVRFVPESSVAMVHGGGDATLRYGDDFYFSDNAFETGDYAGAPVLVAGSLTAPAAFDTAALAGTMLVLSVTPRTRAERARIAGWQAAGVVYLNADPDSLWTRRVVAAGRPQLRHPVRRVGRMVTLTVRAAALRPVFDSLGVDPAARRGGEALTAIPLPDVAFHIHAAVRVVDHASAPNVVGILEGSDPGLKHEYVVYSAHMDHLGVGAPVNGDSVYNGADDDASGTIAVVEAAEAFAQLEPRPRRSIIFLTVSGEEKGLWGSAYFTENPPVPLAQVVADLNLDMVGRNWRDTIVVIGKEHSDLGGTLHRVGAAHPELGMRPIDDLWPEQSYYTRSDHYNFARRGVPILFFFNGTHPDYHRVSDSPDKIDVEKEARIIKLAFYVGLEVANAAQRPRWSPRWNPAGS